MTGLTNAEKKALKALQTKKGRREQGRFMAEGIALLGESLLNEIRPEVVYYSDALMNSRGRALLRNFRAKKTGTVELAAQELSGICGTETSQGLLGVFEIPAPKSADIIKKRSRVLLLDNISDPGNAGTLIRSAAAFGFDAVAVTNYSVEPYNPKVVRSSAGTIFSIPIIAMEADELIALKQILKIPLISADVNGSPLSKMRLKINKKTGMFLAIGAEATGISMKLDRIADLKIRIRHDKRVESLNAAVAGSIIMKEVYEL